MSRGGRPGHKASVKKKKITLFDGTAEKEWSWDEWDRNMNDQLFYIIKYQWISKRAYVRAVFHV